MASCSFTFATALIGTLVMVMSGIIAASVLLRLMVGIFFGFRWRVVHVGIIVMTTELIVAIRIKVVTIRVQERPVRINVEALFIVVPAITPSIIVSGVVPMTRQPLVALVVLTMVAFQCAARPPSPPLLEGLVPGTASATPG